MKDWNEQSSMLDRTHRIWRLVSTGVDLRFAAVWGAVAVPELDRYRQQFPARCPVAITGSFIISGAAVTVQVRWPQTVLRH